MTEYEAISISVPKNLLKKIDKERGYDTRSRFICRAIEEKVDK